MVSPGFSRASAHERRGHDRRRQDLGARKMKRRYAVGIFDFDSASLTMVSPWSMVHRTVHPPTLV